MTSVNKDIDYPELDYFMNQSLSDVLFVIDGQRMPANKHVLSFKSRVFRAMFSGNFKETEEPKDSKLIEIVIKDTKFEAFKTMIRFIYTEELVFNYDNDWNHICDVYQLSDRYDVLRLRQRIDNYLESRFTNFEDLISFSTFVFGLNIEEFMAKVMSFIESNINNLVKRKHNELKRLNDAINDLLLDVLTNKYFTKQFDDFLVQWDLFQVIKGYITCKRSDIWDSDDSNNDTTFEAFKTFVGYLYFDKLILKDDNDFQLIREVCRLAKKYQKTRLLQTIVGKHLQNRISVENFESISGIAFDYNFRALLKKVNAFKKVNLKEINEKFPQI